MYQLLRDIVGYNLSDNYQQYIIYGAVMLAIISLVGFIRIMIDIIRSFWKGGRKNA